MTTTNNNLNEMKAYYENILNVCNKKIEAENHPEIYGFCIDKCNSIVINKERLMTVTTDKNSITTYEFSPLTPTYFAPEAAELIVKSDIYYDSNNNPIKMEIIGKLEYYTLLKDYAVKNLENIKLMEKVIA